MLLAARFGTAAEVGAVPAEEWSKRPSHRPERPSAPTVWLVSPAGNLQLFGDFKVSSLPMVRWAYLLFHDSSFFQAFY